MESLKTRLNKYVEENGVKIYHIADKAGIDPDVLYRLRGGAQKTLGESDAIKLHDYLKSKEPKS